MYFYIIQNNSIHSYFDAFSNLTTTVTNEDNATLLSLELLVKCIKSLESDGMNSALYQQCWSIMGLGIVRKYCLKCVISLIT